MIRNWVIGLTILASGSLAQAQGICATPGNDGPQNSSGPVNTFYPPVFGTLAAGSTSVTVNAVPGPDVAGNSFGNVPISPGDLILIIQMQDATIDASDTASYGSGVAANNGSGQTNMGNSGLYEYVVARSTVPLTGGTLTFRGGGAGGGTINTYTQAAATATRGQRTFQVVRVPQYSSLTLASDVNAPRWNGTVGGIVAFDVAGDMNFAGRVIDASGAGFRGGFLTVNPAGGKSAVYRAANTSQLGAGKGEGTAGTPQFMWDGFSAVNSGVQGYPNGDLSRGAPANAGGGGNEHNAGGGGGGNGGAGGQGGFTWEGAGGAPTPADTSGRPGSTSSTAAPAVGRLIMGGGGGGGDANNATTGVRGGVGGGIVLIRAGRILGAGTIRANGTNGERGAVGSAPDGAGGGGAGGTVLVSTLNSSPTATLTIAANGGRGGNTANDGNVASTAHGPGGGGGGGVVLTNVPGATIPAPGVLGGANGLSNDGLAGSIPHGATAGSNGVATTFTAATDPFANGFGAACYPVLQTTKTEANPGPAGARVPPTTAVYTIVTSNSGTSGAAGGVQITDTLPSGFTFASATVTYTNNATGPTSPLTNQGTASNPVFGNFNIPAGGSVQITLTVNIAATVPNGTYNNSAQANYLDPTRSTPTRRITPATGAGPGSNTTYEGGTSAGQNVPGSNYNGTAAGATGEDVVIVHPDLTITKTHTPATFNVGSTGTFSITVTNKASAAGSTGGQVVTVTDVLPAQFTPTSASFSSNGWACTATGQTVTCTRSDTLAPGSSYPVLNIPVNVVGAITTPITNTATVSTPGEDPALGTTGDNTATDTVSVASIGVAKRVSSGPTRRPDGSYDASYVVVVQNLGGVALSNAQVTDNLNTTFPAPATFTVTSVTGTDANSAFNGSSNQNLLVAGVTLAPGASRTITVNFNLRPNGAPPPFNNTAVATGNPPSGPAVTDQSNNGANPDPNGNGNPGDSGENTPTPLTGFPAVGSAKAVVGTPQRQANGSFNVDYSVVVKNVGSTVLNNVQATDDLTVTFPAPTTFTVSNVAGTGSNAGFNGNTNKNLLAAGVTLNPGESRTVTFTVNIVPNGNFGPFNNSVLASGTSPDNQTVTDPSDNGSDPDPNGNGNPGDSGENDPTPIALAAQPAIGAAKAASASAAKADGSYDVTYTVVVRNYGDITLQNVQATDNLSATFPNPATFSVVSISGSGANSAFNGTTNQNLLAPNVSLNPTESRTLTVVVNVNPNGNFGPFNNTVNAVGTPAPTAQNPNPAPVTDVSNNGTNPNPSGDNNPNKPSENVPTPISFTPNPVIGTAKAVSSGPVLQADNSYLVTYSVVVRNYGNTVLNSVQATDNLSATFPSPTTFTVTSVSGTGSNPAFNGSSNQNLLASGVTLNPGDSRTITFTVRIVPNGAFGPFNNTVNASGTPPTGPAVTDVSNNGSNPDPNGDGNPGGSGENTPTPVTLNPNPVIGTAKTVTSGPTLQGNGTYNITYSVVVRNYGNVALNNAQATDNLTNTFEAPATFTVSNVSGTGANASFNGSSNQNLLAAGITLQPGESRTVQFTVNVTPNGNFGPFANTVTARGTAAAGPATTVTDTSNNGTDPNPSGDNQPNKPAENTPTVTSLTPNAVIGTAKSAGPAIRQANGSYNITYTTVVRNYGNTVLNGVQATDNLSSTFPAPSTFTVSSVSGTDANAGFNGNTNRNLLAANVTLNPGESRTITFTVNVVPNGQFGPFDNTVIASGTPPPTTAVPNPSPVSDVSQDGTNPDPNGDGDPTQPGENTPTRTTFNPNPVIGTAKAVSAAILQANGSYTLTYTVVVQNYGNITLENVQATDNLSLTFPGPTTFTVSNVSGSGANPGFNGSSNRNLLAGGVTLQPGESRTITYTVNVVPNGAFGPFDNVVVASGTTPPGTPGGSQTVTDVSNSGTNPDPNGDGDPTQPSENNPTRTSLTPNPVIGAAKSASAPALQPDGSYVVTYSVLIRNYGNIRLENASATDDLGATFGAPTTYTVTSVSGTSANPGFNGSSDKNLLASGVTLEPGDSRTVTFTVRIVPNGNFGPFNNSVVVRGNPPGGVPVTDVSDNSNSGLNPDPNGNGDPTEPGENVPTPVTLTPRPAIGTAKAASTSAAQPDGSYNITYTVLVRNLGNVVLNGVQATDDLTQTFPSPATFSVTSVSGTDANTGFNGNANKNLLAAGVSLQPGESRTITVVVNLRPGTNNFGPFNNTVLASGTPPATAGNPNPTPVTDLSNNGSNPDPNGNGDATESGENTPTPVSLSPNPVIGTAKAAGPALPQPNGSYNVTYTVIVRNYGNVTLENVQATDDLTTTFPAPTTFTVSSVSGAGSNAGFNGGANKNLLAPGVTLQPGESRTVTFTVNVVPNGVFGPFNNTVIATGTPPATPANPTPTPVSDRSNNGNNPNPSGDNDPTKPSENQPTPVSLTPNPVIGTAKAVAGPPTLNADGSFTVRFVVYVRNYGNTVLNNAQAIDDLTQTFPSPTTFTVSNISGAGANTAFNGNSDKNLLAAGTNLGIGESRRIEFSVTVNPNGNYGPFNNSVIAQGTAPAQGGNPPRTVTDRSNDDPNFNPNDPASNPNPDPNGNNDPTEIGENNPTPVPVNPIPLAQNKLRLEKTVSAPVAKVGEPLGYTLKAFNDSPVAMPDLRIDDNLPYGLVYRPGSSLVNGTALEPTVTQTTDAKGRPIQRLSWAVPGLLAPGASATVQFAVNVTPVVPEGENIVNTAVATAFGGQVTSNTAAAAVKVSLGVFGSNTVILGRVYFDANDNNSFEAGIDTPLAGARVYLSDGRYAITDDQGRYSLPEVSPGLYAVRLDPLTVPYQAKPVPDDQGQRGTRYVRTPIGGGISTEDFPLYPAKGAAVKARSTTVTRGNVTLVKALQQGGAGYAVSITVTLSGPVSNLTITDPLPQGATRGEVQITNANGQVIRATVQDGRIVIPGVLEPGKYTIAYVIFTPLPPELVITDPDINYDEVIR